MHGLRVKSHFIMKILHNKIGAQYLPLELTIFDIFKFFTVELSI